MSFRVLSSPGGTANVFILLDLTIENGIFQRTKNEDFDILPSILNPTLEPFGRIFIELICFKFNDYLGKPLIYGRFQRIVG